MKFYEQILYMSTKKDVTESIHEELTTRFVDDNTDCIDFVVRALGNFFTTDQLEEFYEFLKDE